MKTTQLTKTQIQDLIDAISYMSTKDWTKYNENGSPTWERLTCEEARKRQGSLLEKLYEMKSKDEKTIVLKKEPNAKGWSKVIYSDGTTDYINYNKNN